MINTWLNSSISFAADALAQVARVARPAGKQMARFKRLVSLRSTVNGNVPVTTQFDGPVHTTGRLRLTLGEYCRLGRDVFFETCERGWIELGAHVRINMGCVLVSYARITIGSDCLIGEYVSIRDADHGMAPGELMRLQEHTAAPITIGDDVWIGRGVSILKGVSIGPGAVIAANSVITKHVPSMAIVAGAPGRVLRFRESCAAPMPTAVR